MFPKLDCTGVLNISLELRTASLGSISAQDVLNRRFNSLQRYICKLDFLAVKIVQIEIKRYVKMKCVFTQNKYINITEL